MGKFLLILINFRKNNVSLMSDYLNKAISVYRFSKSYINERDSFIDLSKIKYSTRTPKTRVKRKRSKSKSKRKKSKSKRKKSKRRF